MFCRVSRHFDKFPHHDVAGHILTKLFTLDLKMTAGFAYSGCFEIVLRIKMDIFMFYYGRYQSLKQD